MGCFPSEEPLTAVGIIAEYIAMGLGSQAKFWRSLNEK